MKSAVNWKAGDKLKVYPRLMPDAERQRLEAARCRVDQNQHQFHPDPAQIEAVIKSAMGKRYLVRVFVTNKPAGALRYYDEQQARDQFKVD